LAVDIVCYLINSKGLSIEKKITHLKKTNVYLNNPDEKNNIVVV